MSETLTLSRQPSDFPRPTSLTVPDRSFVTATPILDTSSYSPFPTFPGSSHTRDPYGLNAYLLHPEDVLWSYVDPSPATVPDKQPQTQGTGVTRRPSLLKQRSLSHVRQPSPLATQQSLPEDEEESSEEGSRSPRSRKRSNSVDSLPSPLQHGTHLEEVMPEASLREAPRSSRKSLRKVMHRARRGFFASSDNLAAFNPPPPVPTFTRISSEDGDPGTPMSSRSISNRSELSSRSSTASSEGIQTPCEGLQIDVGIAGLQLADALLEAEGAKGRGKSWRGWLASKKTASVLKSKSGHTTPVAVGAMSSPSISTVSLSLTAGLAAQPASTSDPSMSLQPPPPVNPFTIEQLRRMSYRKMGQLRSPSPHPLALHLQRQHFNLPDEVALAIQSGQRVFPLSVNVIQPIGGNVLTPSNGGLRSSLGIRSIISRLDGGQCPSGSLSVKSLPSRSGTLSGPRGVIDFIDRPPYEDRNIVFFPNGTLSPISMARPGYGVWDLDYSPYILALSHVDDPMTSLAWQKLPRVSMIESLDDFDTVVPSLKAREQDPSSEADLNSQEESSGLDQDSPEFDQDSPDLDQESPDLDQGELVVSPPAVVEDRSELLGSQEPTVTVHSSFRSVKNLPTEETSDEEVSEEEEDEDEPLAMVFKKRSLSSLLLSRPTAAATATATAPQGVVLTSARPVPIPTHARAKSHSDARLTNIRRRESEEIVQRRAMDEVVRARERRQAAVSGELERRAVADQRRAENARRSSTYTGLRTSASTGSVNVLLSQGQDGVRDRSDRIASAATATGMDSSARAPSVHVHVSPASPPMSARPADSRRRVQSTYDTLRPPLRPPTRHTASASGVGQERRYHSFYETNGSVHGVDGSAYGKSGSVHGKNGSAHGSIGVVGSNGNPHGNHGSAHAATAAYSHPAMRAFHVPVPAAVPVAAVGPPTSMIVQQGASVYAYSGMPMAGSRMSLAVPPAAHATGRRRIA